MAIQSRLQSLQDTLGRLLKFALQGRHPLRLQAHKPIPIPTYVPKFEHTSSNYLRNRDPRSRAQRSSETACGVQAGAQGRDPRAAQGRALPGWGAAEEAEGEGPRVQQPYEARVWHTRVGAGGGEGGGAREGSGQAASGPQVAIYCIGYRLCVMVHVYLLPMHWYTRIIAEHLALSYSSKTREGYGPLIVKPLVSARRKTRPQAPITVRVRATDASRRRDLLSSIITACETPPTHPGVVFKPPIMRK